MRKLAGLVLLCVGCFSEPGGGGEDTGRETEAGSTTTSGPSTSSGSTGRGESTEGAETSSSSGSSSSTTGGETSTTTTGGEAQWNPEQAWLTRFDSELEANGDRVDEVIVAEDGTIWVAGAFAQMPPQLFVAQLDTDGALLDSFPLDGEAITNARGLAETSTGILVGGHGNSPAGATDRLLVEFDRNTQAFGQPYDFGVTTGLDIVESVVVGADDTRFVAGVTQVDEQQRAWLERLGTPGPGWSLEAGGGASDNRATDLYRLGPPDDFDLIVTGALRSGDDDDTDSAWVGRFSITGMERWSTMLASREGYPTVARGATEGASNSVLIVGTVDVPGAGFNAWVQELGNSGSTGWYDEYDGTGRDDVALDVATDAGGDVFVCGSSVGATTGADIWVARFDLNGAYLGQYLADLGESEDDVIASCVVHDGQLIIAGRGTTVDSIRRDGFVAALPIE